MNTDDGTVDRDELEKALKKLGFYHLSAGQIDAIMKRADEDDNCVIDYEEFVKEAPNCVEIKIIRRVRRGGRRDAARWRGDAGSSHPTDWLISTQAPKTLKTNLVKLAKNNGAELGFLS